MLDVENLSVHFSLPNGRTVKALRRGNLNLPPGETLALIGESGSGKSVLGLAVISLLPPARISGRITFKGRDILQMDEKQLLRLRGAEIAFIPQSSGLSLNPTMIVLEQVTEAVPASNNGGRQRARDLLSHFGLSRLQASSYPHQLSGGMRQRALAAIGLATRPGLLIADEPTKGIDHQRIKDVEKIFRQVKRENPEMSLLLVTHDLELASSMADQVSVMYAGCVVETSPGRDFFRRPRHPYSQALLEASPQRGLKPIPGQSPGVEEDYAGCPFAPRCPHADDRCRSSFPDAAVQNGGAVHCWHYDQT